MSMLEPPAPSPPTRSSTRPPPLEDYDTLRARTGRSSRRCEREGGDWAEERAAELGALAGRREALALGRRGQREPAEAARPTTATATASTRSSSTRRGTG